MPPILSFSLFLCFFYWLNITIDSYIALVSYSALVAVTYYLYAFFVHLETSHKIQIYQNVRKRLKYA
jgi:apolipoprotein N-acyltransferase